MKTKKVSKKLIKLLALSQEGQAGICSALFNKNNVILNGFSNVAITPDIALFYFENEKNLPVFHCVTNDKTDSNYSKDSLLVAIDSRINSNTKFYLQLNDLNSLFCSGMTFEENIKLVLYFEYDSHSIFVIGFTEPSSKKFIVECISSQNQSSTAFNRFLIGNILENIFSERFTKIIHPIFKDYGEINAE